MRFVRDGRGGFYARFFLLVEPSDRPQARSSRNPSTLTFGHAMTSHRFPDGRSFAALLFDMDGTLLSSIEAAERVWTRWAARHGLDARTFLPSIHGKRAVDTIRDLGIPGVNAAVEAELLTRMEIEDTEGVHAIAGARTFVESLPASRWAIVTSAPRALAIRRLEAAGVQVPAVLVTAEDVR